MEVEEVGTERELEPLQKRLVVSLETIALSCYIRFLEEECASYVALTHIDSPVLNPAKDRQLTLLKKQINTVVVGVKSSEVRKRLYDEVISGRYPTPKHRNSHLNVDSRQVNSEDDDENEANNDLEKIKHFGRRCCSPCCTGAFIVEVMLSVIVNEDIEILTFPSSLKQKIFKSKNIRKFLFFDIPSILVHYTKRLNSVKKTPALTKLCLEQSNLGSLDSQLVHESILKSYLETKRYYNFPWKFSSHHARASTDFMMLTLSNLFSQPKDHFRYLTTIKLNGECLNTRVNVLGDRGGHAALQLMSGIAYSCPSLRSLDLSQVTSLAPEFLVYLFYQDTFSLLHKYMYMDMFTAVGDTVFHYPSRNSSDIIKHDGVRYCPWCDDPAMSNLVRDGCEFDISQIVFVLDDRLYDYIERGPMTARENLTYCVKTSQLLTAFTDDVHELQRPEDATEGFPDQEEECTYVKRKVTKEATKSSLCDTLMELLLPMDIVDSKAWIIPLFLSAAPQLKSLGDCIALEGLKVAEALGLYQFLRPPFNLEQINICLEDFTNFKVKERILRCLKSLMSKHPHWHHFAAAGGDDTFSLGHWIESELKEVLELSDLAAIKSCWREQIDTLVWTCPNIRSIKMTIQPSVLYSNDKDIWQKLTKLEHLSELHLYSSSWADVLGLLEVVGQKITNLSLMLNTTKSLREDDISSMEFVNTIPFLCPNLKEVFLGYIQGDLSHSLCANTRFNIDSSFQYLTVFEATGNMTLEALQFLWKRARVLETLRVTGNIVSASTTHVSPINEVVFNKERISYMFEENPMKQLKILDVPMTLTSILAARTLLQLLPKEMISIATLNVKVSIPDSLEGENFGDLVSSVLARMASFKNECLCRVGEVVWNWKREGILTILLQQQMLLSVSDLIDP